MWSNGNLDPKHYPDSANLIVGGTLTAGKWDRAPEAAGIVASGGENRAITRQYTGAQEEMIAL